MGKPASYQVDPALSKEKADQLHAYLSSKVAKTRSERMICRCYTQCLTSAGNASFHEAQGHSVGRSYALTTAAQKPFRVLIVPMEAGGGDSFASVRERTERVRESGQKPFNKRNAHMQGVTLALRLALGMPYQDRHGKPFIDTDEEQVPFIDGAHDHLFECFAMTNLLMCSAVAKAGGQDSRANPTMRKNCVRHLENAIGILKPTLVISQGVTLVKTLRASFGVQAEVDLNKPDSYIARPGWNSDPFVWVPLKHPTRLWRSVHQTYFQDAVVPAIKGGRRRALTMTASSNPATILATGTA